MGVPVLTRHDPGCKHAREWHGGHCDAAKRVADTYNMHIAAGARRDGVIAVALADGTSDSTVYDSRADAVAHQHHNEAWYAFIRLTAPSMTVCEAASVMRWQQHAARLAPAQLGDASGGLEVIPRLTMEGRERQVAAMAGRLGLPLALGRSDS